MRLTKLITIRSLSTRRMRSILTLFGIVIGVACIFAINFTNENAYRSITSLFEGTTGRVSLEIRSSANVGGLPQDLLDEVASTEGVEQAVGYLKLPAALPGEDQEQIDLNFFGTGAGGLMLHGIDPLLDKQLRDYRITEGRFIEEDSANKEKPEVVLVESFAIENSLSVGETITILTAFGPSELKVVGLMAGEGAGLTNLGKFGVITLGVAQELARRTDELDQIDLVATNTYANSEALQQLRDQLAEQLGDEYTVVFPASQGDRMAKMLSGYQIGLNFMAGIALFVGAFLIFNAFSMTVVERTRELGMLRAVGMSQRQVTVQVIIEGIVLGVLGSLLGVATGFLMSQGLMAIMSGLLGQPLDTRTVSPKIMMVSITVGVVVTLLASYLPARQAGRISPLEAIRLRGQKDEGWFDRVGWIMGLLLLIMSVGILVWNPFPYDVQFRLGSLTVFTLFFGAMLIIPVTLRVWHRLSRGLIRLLFGDLGEIGARNLERARRRTMLTCAALMVGVSMIVTTQGMVGSFSADLKTWISAYTAGDVFVSGAVPINYEFKEDLEKIEEVEHAAPLRYIEVSWLTGEEEEKISLMGIDPDSYSQVTHFIFSDPKTDTKEAMKQLTQGQAVFISGVIAEKYDLSQGDSITLRTRQSDQVFTVAAVVLDFYNQGMVVTGSWKDLRRYFDIDDVNTFLLKTKEGTDSSQLANKIEDLYKDKYQLIAESNSSLRERADALLSQAFSMFDILGILAVMVAALGVLNTLSMSVIERTREIGMLRCMGMTRWQIVRMILAEAFMMGIIGGVLGLGFGIALTQIFLSAMGAMSGYELDFVMPVRAIWLSLVVALTISQLAALIPAIRAAKTPMLSAIHYE
jgi:putative ABC transport system permease protein